MQKLKHKYKFDPEVSLIKKGSPVERTGFRRSRLQMFFKIVVLKTFINSTGIHPVLESLFNKSEGLKTFNSQQSFEGVL